MKHVSFFAFVFCFCSCQEQPVTENPPPPGGPAVLFGPVPDAYRFPDDDVDEDVAGLQVDVPIEIENGDDISEVTLLSRDTTTAPVERGHALARATLEVSRAGFENLLVAEAGDVSAQRSVIGLDVSEEPEPPAPACSLTVDGVGVAVVACTGGDPDSAREQGTVRGGLLSLRTARADDDTDFRIRTQELRGGVASFSFAFSADGSYNFSASLVNAPAVFGSAVGASATAIVDVE